MDSLDIVEGVDNDVALSDDETITVQDLLKALESAWLNEKFSPELLRHKGEIVECMYEQIHGMEENIERVPAGDLRVEVCRLELDRMRYILGNYLRTRLEKIEEFASHILEQESRRDPDERYLTPGERKFAEDYQASVESHFEALALRHMPSNLQDFERRVMKIEPNLNSYVFLRANVNVEGLMLEGMDDADEPLDLTEGSQHLALYSGVASLVKNGSLQLI